MLLLPLGEMVHGARGVFRDKQKAFLFWWIALPLVFFSLSANKLPGYLLPVLPPLTLWIAILVEQASRAAATRKGTASAVPESPQDPGAAAPEVRSRVHRTAGNQAPGNSASCGLPEAVPPVLIGCSALLLLTVPLFAPLLAESLATGLRQALADWSIAGAWREILQGAVPVSRWLVLAGAVGFTFYFAARKQALYASYMLLAGVAVCLLAITAHLSPAINSVASARSVADRIVSLAVPAEEVAVYRIHRNQTYQLSYYLEHGLPEWSPDDTASNASIVVAAQDQEVLIARPVSFFPGQRLRVWELIGLRIGTERQ